MGVRFRAAAWSLSVRITFARFVTRRPRAVGEACILLSAPANTGCMEGAERTLRFFLAGPSGCKGSCWRTHPSGEINEVNNIEVINFTKEGANVDVHVPSTRPNPRLWSTRLLRCTFAFRNCSYVLIRRLAFRLPRPFLVVVPLPVANFSAAS